MRRIGDVLRGVDAPQIDPGQEYVAPAADVCPRCHGAQWLRRVVPVGDPLFGEPVPCPTCYGHILEAKRLGVAIEQSRMRQQLGVTFEEVRPRHAQAQAWLDAALYADDPRGWLVLQGPNGGGKTTLALCVANRALSRGLQVVFQFVPNLLDHLRDTYRPGSEVTYDQLFEQVRSVPLLVLDDLGAQRATDWAIEKLVQIVKSRSLENLSTVITTNLEVNHMEPRIRTCLIDPDRCHVVRVRGQATGLRDER